MERLEMADKKKFELEFIIKTSPKILYPRLSTPDGLAEWFCDDVDLNQDNFVFNWGGSEEVAKVLSKKTDNHIKFQWEDDQGTDYYFEFKLKPLPMTGDIALLVTDYSEPDELEESTNLWESQIADLKSNLGLA